MDVDIEWRNRSEAEASTSAYNDDDGDEAFHFFLHELFPKGRIDLPNILICILTYIKCALNKTVHLSGHALDPIVVV